MNKYDKSIAHLNIFLIILNSETVIYRFDIQASIMTKVNAKIHLNVI